jgi:hypothetical protein
VQPVAGIDLPVCCAFSLVTAVDYFPLVDQIEVEQWIERDQHVPVGLARNDDLFPQGGPPPMSDGRFQWDDESLEGGPRLTWQLPNCSLPHPLRRGERAFGLHDPTSFTATAVVGQPSQGRSLGKISRPARTLSWLPDAAADVYAPGWDVSQHQTRNRNMMVSYGLGSPFPEDAKLCAALNSFWPAVAPDSSRTYGMRPPRDPEKPDLPGRMLYTSLPLTDRELGYAPAHPRAAAGEVSIGAGWDGDFGAFFEMVGIRRYVNASNPLRADHTRAALEGRIHLAGLDCLTTEAFLARLDVLAWCRKTLDRWCLTHFLRVLQHRESGWWLVRFEEIANWDVWTSETLPRADPTLLGAGYILSFALVGAMEEFESPPKRVRYPVQNWFDVQIASRGAFGSERSPDPGPIAFASRDGGLFEQLQV